MSRKAIDNSGGFDISGGQMAFVRMIIYSVLGWFTITVQAFLRYNFGERYFTKPNFFIGFWLLLSLSAIAAIISSLLSIDVGFFRVNTSGLAAGMSYMIIGYCLFSLYHFWRIWVNNQSGYPQHSFYGGVPHLLPLGKLVAKVLNPPLTIAARAFGKLTLKRWNYEQLDAALKIKPPIQDVEKITKLWIEPLVVFLVAFYMTGLVSVWLNIAGAALFLYSHLTYEERRFEELDISDSFVEAAFMKKDANVDKNMRSKVEELLNVVKKRAATEPDYIETLKEKNPSVFEALDELDIDLGDES